MAQDLQAIEDDLVRLDRMINDNEDNMNRAIDNLRAELTARINAVVDPINRRIGEAEASIQSLMQPPNDTMEDRYPGE